MITNDKDFGELTFKEKLSHCGVIFLRLNDETATNKIFILKNLLHNHTQFIGKEHFIVVTESAIRIIG